MMNRLTAAAVFCPLALLIASCSGSETLQSGPAEDERAAPVTDERPDEMSLRSATDGEDQDEESAGTQDTDDGETAAPDPDDDDDTDADEDRTDETEEQDEHSTDETEEEDTDTDTDTDSADEPVDEVDTRATSTDIGLTASGPGDSGDHVLALQERLAELGFAPGTPDGSFGRRTARAIVAFQDLVGINETGRADARTLGALASYRYDGLVLESGDEGQLVETLQKRLAGGPFDPGTADGVYGTSTTQAVWALEKMAGIPVDGNWGPLDERAWEKLEDGQIGGPEKSHDQRWVEVDLSEQIMKVYDPGFTTPVLVSHASSGSGVPWENEEFSGSSITPLGDFQINRRISGWRESSLDIGRLYNPLYFNGGIAFHGATSVPLYPASHGCIRLPMHVADYLPSELPNGTPVHILS